MDNGAKFEARGDGKHLWTYFRVATSVGFGVGALVAVVLIVQNPKGSVAWAVTCGLIVPVLVALISGAFTIYWRLGVLPIGYAIAADNLQCVRNGRVLDEYPVSRIASVSVTGYIDIGRLFFTSRYYPKWPRLLILLKSEHSLQGELVKFPPIMIWGREQANNLQSELQDILRTRSL